jgi:hypothetical protein
MLSRGVVVVAAAAALLCLVGFAATRAYREVRMARVDQALVSSTIADQAALVARAGALVSAYPDSSRSHELLGHSLLRQANGLFGAERAAALGAAEQAYARAHQLRPHWPNLPANQATARALNGKFDAALEQQLELAFKLGPYDLEVNELAVRLIFVAYERFSSRMQKQLLARLSQHALVDTYALLTEADMAGRLHLVCDHLVSQDARYTNTCASSGWQPAA